MNSVKLNCKPIFHWTIAGLVAATLAVAAPIARSQSIADTFVMFDSPELIPDLEFFREDGSAVSLAYFQGKTVLLNIWATWCGPCRREMPALDRLRALLGGDDFEVVALSIDRGGAEAVKPFFREIGIENLEIYLDSSGNASRILRVMGLPSTFLIDRNGRKAGVLVGPAEWDTPGTISFLQKQITAHKRAQGPLEPQFTKRQRKEGNK